MTQSHIHFAPLILERKTPAEELREIIENAPYQAGRRTMEMVELVAARLEAPDDPKRWDGVFPWASPLSRGSKSCVAFFGNRTRAYFYESGTVSVNALSERTEPFTPAMLVQGDPYHDGVIITITAGDGTEDVKVLRGTADDRWLYLALGDHSVVLTDPYGDAVGEAKDRWPKHCEPLPPGTVTRITISNHGATTEQRYSVEVVEPEQPKFAPITVANERVKVGVESEKIRMDYLTLGGSQIFSADEAREIRDALSAALEFGNPTQEQPTTEAVLEIKCDSTLGDVLNVTNGPYGNVVFQVNNSRTVIASPDDEARLRNLLNQRHADGKGCDPN